MSAKQQQDDPELYELAQEVAIRSHSMADRAIEEKISKDSLHHRDKMLVGREDARAAAGTPPLLSSPSLSLASPQLIRDEGLLSLGSFLPLGGHAPV